MNEQERTELAALKERQMRLARELDLLSNQLQSLERRLSSEEPPVVQSPPPIPPVLASAPRAAFSAPPAQPATAPHVQAASASPEVSPEAAAKQPDTLSLSQLDAKVGTEEQPEPPRAPRTERSLELRLGTYWAPRIGIVVLLTGLVFIGNLAYQNLGPAGKVLLLYVASAILLGAGGWWQRRSVKGQLRNYAQVVFAGGLAALYFTTYAAHYVDSLRVIHSAVLDAILLLGCAGLMVWTADRWKSEVLAIFGAGLAYYACILTRGVGFFTLYSNLVLTVAAVFFLVRNRWAVLTFGSVFASYGAYAFWRFLDGGTWQWASPAEGLWTGTYFLVAYWLVFTAGVFLSRAEKFAGENRAALLTLNNGAFFTMFLLTMLQVQHGGFWKFALIYGAVLVGLAELANRLLPGERPARDFYLSQGLLLVTVGFISKFAGLQLSLVLAAESVLLLMMGNVRKSLVLLAGGYIAAFLSVAWSIDGMRQQEPAGIYLAVGIGALMLLNTLLVHRFSGGTDSGPLLRGDRSYFTVLALVVWLVATWNNTTKEDLPVVLAVEGLVLTLSLYAFRIREITLLGQAFLVLSLMAWLVRWAPQPVLVPWWNASTLLGAFLFLTHWWKRQKAAALPPVVPLIWQGVYGLGIVAVLFFWLHARVEAPTWLALTSLLVIGLTAYGVLTRAWLLAAWAQVFALMSAIEFGWQLLNGKPLWIAALAPMAALFLLSWTTVRWFKVKPESNPQVREPLLRIALGYRWVGIAMTIAWVCEYIAPSERIWVLSFLGVLVFLAAGWKKSLEGFIASMVFTTMALALFWSPAFEGPVVYWANVPAILALLIQQQIARNQPERYRLDPIVHSVLIVVGCLSLWRFCSAWVLDQASGFYLTASWSFLALVFFACGIVLRERVYRWLGLGLLACALGRVIIFDVWKLQTVYRILSFMALGIVLLVLGYVYSKYQEKIKQWL